MNFWYSAVVFGLLLLAAAGLFFWNLRQWRKVRPESISKDEHDYRRRQFRRRLQSSAMLGAAGVAIFVPELLPQKITENPYFLLYWVAVMLMVLWVVLLAAVDIWATKFYYDRLRNAYFHEKLKLEAELRRAQTTRSNGKPKKPK
jgi:hypothetical protein